MKTLLTDDVGVAAEFLREGHVVAFPTETVYGLGADATNAEAVQRIFQAKRRPADNPLIVHVSSLKDVAGIVTSVSKSAEAFMNSFFPGPLTLILERGPSIPAIVSAGLTTVGVRMPAHTLASELIRATGRPLAAPSANLSGRPSPTSWESVQEDLDGYIACILKGERTRVGLESTVVDCTTELPVVLRAGGITLEALKSVVPETQAVEPANIFDARSPGLRHRHYAPSAQVIVVDDPSLITSPVNAAYIGESLPENSELFDACEQVAGVDAYAYRLYEFFRECDRLGIETIFCQKSEESGVGVALNDRLERAARR